MNKSHIKISEGNLTEVIKLAQLIPEFKNLYSNEEFEKRLNDVKHFILIASYKEKPIGFKIGYETPSKKYFYSWMGGVISKYRKIGAAQLLMNSQENWAKKNNYESILVKTRKKYLAMINLLENNNYYEMGILPYDSVDETRILYEKKL